MGWEERSAREGASGETQDEPEGASFKEKCASKGFDNVRYAEGAPAVEKNSRRKWRISTEMEESVESGIYRGGGANKKYDPD